METHTDHQGATEATEKPENLGLQEAITDLFGPDLPFFLKQQAS